MSTKDKTVYWDFTTEERELIKKSASFMKSSWLEPDILLLDIINDLRTGRPFTVRDKEGFWTKTPEVYKAYKLYEKIKSSYNLFLVLQEYVNHKVWESIQ